MILETLLLAAVLMRIDARPVSAAAWPPPATDTVREWIASRMEPVPIGEKDSSIVPAGLARVVRGARVIGLGESAHHKHELQQLRFQLTRELVRRHGVRAVTMETGYADALLLDQWLSDPSVSEPDLSAALPYAGDGEQEEIRAALRWLKRYNDRQPVDSRVRFIGIDMSNGGGALRPPVERVWEYLDRVDRELARASRSRLAPALEQLGSGYSRTAKQRFDSLSADERTLIVREVASLRDRMTQQRVVYVGATSSREYEQARHALEVAEQTLDFMRHDARDPSNPRDHALANNVLWALKTLPPSSGLVVWAHNAHVQKQPIDVPAMRMATPPPSMGVLLEQRLGDRYRAIGTAVGSFPPDSTRADPASVDALFASLGKPSFFLGFRDEPGPASTPGWLRMPQLMRFESLYIRVVPARAFDALVYVDRASPGIVRPQPPRVSAQAEAPRIVAPHGPKSHSPRPTTAAISVADVMTREYIIADDSMEGRDTGKRGGLRSATYLAAELEKLGLQPAGDNGTYFQAVPWIIRRPDSASRLAVGGADLRWGDDYLLLPKLGFALALGGQPFGGSFRGENLATIYGGRIGDSTIAPDLADGKVVVFGPAAERPTFAFWQRDDLRRYARARAIVVATLDLGAPATLRGARETYWDTLATDAIGPLTVLSVTGAVAARIFGGDLSSLEPGTVGLPLSGSVAFIDQPSAYPAYNVVGILPGRDPALRRTYVAIGAHHDHVGMGPPVDHDSLRAFNAVVRPRGADDPPPREVTAAQWAAINRLVDSLHRANGRRVDSVFNGADDDGSGTVLGLEIAESFAKARVKPRRSLLFVFHTAEERGLFGSQYFADHPTVPRDSIVAQINMDQMGRGGPEDAPPGGRDALVVIGLRRRSNELGGIAERVNARRDYRFRFDYQFDKDGDPTNAYCRSDHYMYARYGIPVAFFVAAAWHVDYHMVTDEPQYIDFARTARIGNYIRDVVRDVADLSDRPALTGPKPDPHGLCRT
ncbi:MAG TPA: erythromycin esterase family protein [Gemmatimonadaceae bacterium]|nr:erythromycin esterase family protein [Gemmatimonadaceae bacterium]